MASLIPSDVVAESTGALMDHFDTFKRPLVVIKQPIETIINVSDGNYPGYGEPITETNITHTPVSGIFWAMKSIPKATDKVQEVPATVNAVYNTQIKIKVLQDAKDYIMQGKTESVVFDNLKYNVISAPIPQNFLGLQFYLFHLNQTD